MSKGLLEQILEQLTKFNENAEKLLSVQTEINDTKVVVSEMKSEIAEVKKEAPKKAATKKSTDNKVEEAEKQEAPQVEETQTEEAETETALISDDDIKKVVLEARKRNSANLSKAKDFITEKGISKITEIEQSDRQAFIDYMESL
ncbi:hypothetical protein [Macrococcus capreoli]|uniref:hypothetical protein n=1 Tax=Macrococcus capreoli TaxID=2982690 RepID=UPI003EE4B1BE